MSGCELGEVWLLSFFSLLLHPDELWNSPILLFKDIYVYFVYWLVCLLFDLEIELNESWNFESSIKLRVKLPMNLNTILWRYTVQVEVKPYFADFIWRWVVSLMLTLPGVHWIWGWMSPGGVLDVVVNTLLLLGIKFHSFSQSLYRYLSWLIDWHCGSRNQWFSATNTSGHHLELVPSTSTLHNYFLKLHIFVNFSSPSWS